MTQREQKIFMNIYGSIAFPCGQRPKGSWSFVLKTKICYEKTVRDLRAFRFANRIKERLWPFEFNYAVYTDRSAGDSIDEHIGWMHVF